MLPWKSLLCRQNINLLIIISYHRPFVSASFFLRFLSFPVILKPKRNEGGISLKIIDAHIHYCPKKPYFDTIAREAGHENTESHLLREFKRLGIEHAVVMGNQTLDSDAASFPESLSWCVGIDERFFTEETPSWWYDRTERLLASKACVGIKLYPGYSHHYITDKKYEPIYELAEFFHKPVAVHTGATAGTGAMLKYSHPLTVDEAAVRFPGVRFVLCHLGNPWITDAAAVLDKNENVTADLSGILEGNPSMDQFLKDKAGYLSHIRTWLEYLDRYDKLMYGTDWPLANMEGYIAFTMSLIPEKKWDQVFYENARRIYGL